MKEGVEKFRGADVFQREESLKVLIEVLTSFLCHHSDLGSSNVDFT